MIKFKKNLERGIAPDPFSGEGDTRFPCSTPSGFRPFDVRPLSRNLEYAPEVESRCREFPSAVELRDPTLVRSTCHLSWFGLDAWPRLATPRGHDATVGACYDPTRAGNIYGLSSAARRLMGNAANRKNRSACPFRVANRA